MLVKFIYERVEVFEWIEFRFFFFAFGFGFGLSLTLFVNCRLTSLHNVTIL